MKLKLIPYRSAHGEDSWCGYCGEPILENDWAFDCPALGNVFCCPACARAANDKAEEDRLCTSNPTLMPCHADC